MKKIVLLVALSLGMSVDVLAEEMGHHHKEEKGFYIVTKALVTTPETVEHGTNITLASEVGAGAGIDIGYKLPYNFAVEFDFSYDHNLVTENNNGLIETGDASYMTYGVDMTYTLHLNHALGLMGKVGYEIEDEEISALQISALEQAFVYGLGLEYVVNSHYEIVAEYEQSLILSARGSSIYTGIKYNF